MGVRLSGLLVQVQAVLYAVHVTMELNALHARPRPAAGPPPRPVRQVKAVRLRAGIIPLEIADRSVKHAISMAPAVVTAQISPMERLVVLVESVAEGGVTP